jgi:hypothetical protein
MFERARIVVNIAVVVAIIVSVIVPTNVIVIVAS